MFGEKFSNVLNLALREWRKQQIDKDEGYSLDKFAAQLGFSQSAISTWLNNKQSPNLESLIKITPKLAEILGNQVYIDLGLLRNGELLKNYIELYETISPADREEMLKTVYQFAQQRGYAVAEQPSKYDQENEP